MSSLAVYVLILSGALAEDRPGLCRDRVSLAIEAAPTFIDARVSRAKAEVMARAIVAEDCSSGLMFVRGAK
jgi:hypothetical protein